MLRKSRAAEMSLILDALKKSEQERQRDKAPGLQSIHQPITRPVQKNDRWQKLVLLVLLAVNVGALIYWYAQKKSDTSPMATSAIATAEQPAIAASPPATGSVQRAEPPTAAVAPPAAEYTKISPAQNQNSSARAAISQSIEEVGELPDEVRNNLPAMTFSFHVYSLNPQQRTIIINNRRMREGDEVSAGVQLQEITEDGVILGYEQHRIHISVLSGW